MKKIDLEEVKLSVMKIHNYKEKYWSSLSLDDQAILLDSVCQEYGKQVAIEQREVCAKKVLIFNEDDEADYNIAEFSILNCPLVTD